MSPATTPNDAVLHPTSAPTAAATPSVAGTGIRLVAMLAVKRVGLPLDRFSRLYSPAEATALLSCPKGPKGPKGPWMPALADILREHYGAQVFDKIPSEMREWRQQVASGATRSQSGARSTSRSRGTARMPSRREK